MTENKGCRAERSRQSRRRFNAKAAGGIFRIRWPHPDGNHRFKRRTLNAEHPTSEDLPAEGLEPTRPCGHWILSPARLPIPPRRLLESLKLRIRTRSSSVSDFSFAACHAFEKSCVIHPDGDAFTIEKG